MIRTSRLDGSQQLEPLGARHTLGRRSPDAVILSAVCISLMIGMAGPLAGCKEQSSGGSAAAPQALRPPAVSRSQFDLLQVGMTQEEVYKILRSPGIRRFYPNAPSAVEVRFWENPNGSWINVNFENGKAVSVSKAGL